MILRGGIMIKKIDIQISNCCNRSCSWCPPYNKKHMPSKIMSNDCFSKIINIIKENHDYISRDFKISISRYNEPLMCYDDFIKYTCIIKECFPNAYMTVHSNGDFLTKERSNKLCEIYNLFIVNRYDTSDDIIAIDEIYNKFDFNYVNNLCLIPDLKRYTFDYFDCKVEYNFLRKETLDVRSRGGLVEIISEHERNYPCDIIGNILEIDVNGDVYPCCEITGMNSKHHCMKIGNIFDEEFQKIYEKLVNKKEEFHICNKCFANMKSIGL